MTLLHCVTQYPAPPEAVNLRAMDTMAAAFGLPVGYSDHTLGIEVSLAAVARGATVIEKHFTLDRTLPGPDHAASLEPDELRAWSAAIRTIEQALGSPVKAPARRKWAIATSRGAASSRHGAIRHGEVVQRRVARLQAARPRRLADGPTGTCSAGAPRATIEPDELIEP